MAKARKKPKPRPYSLHFAEVPKWYADLEAQRHSFAMGDALLLVSTDTDAPASDRPPLTPREQQVLEIIAAHKSIMGKAICAEYQRRSGYIMAQGTLTRQVIPKLKQWYGVDNRRGVGYYIKSTL